VLAELTDRLNESWGEIFTDLERPSTIEYLGLPGSVEGGTITFLGFGLNRETPLFVVKLHRDANALERVGRERAVLDRLAACSTQIAAVVPRLLMCEEIADRWVLVQSVVPGAPLGAPMRPSGLPDLEAADRGMGRISEWLLALARETTWSAAAGRTQFVCDAGAAVQTFSRVFDLHPEERAHAEELMDFLADPSGVSPCVLHGDLCRQNVLSSSGGIRIIDWTDSRLSGSPLHDFLFFVSTYFLQVRDKTGISGITRAFELSFLETNAYARLIRRLLMKHCTSLGIGPDEFVKLFGLFLVEQSVREYERMLLCSRYGLLPQFNTLLAPARDISMVEAVRQQIWSSLFRVFVGRRGEFEGIMRA
jgi:hypothetical protein